MPKINNVVAVHLQNTAASRSYPFTQMTLDQIRDLRNHYEKHLNDKEGVQHMVPAPVIIADAVNALWNDTFQSTPETGGA